VDHFRRFIDEIDKYLLAELDPQDGKQQVHQPCT
jgi:hypothetical protein